VLDLGMAKLLLSVQGAY